MDDILFHYFPYRFRNFADQDGRVVDIVDSLSSLLEGKPPGFFHFLIHAPSSHEYFVGKYFLNNLDEESAEEGFVIIADWKQFYKEQNKKNMTIPQIKQAYFSVCSAEDYKNDPLAFENLLLTALQEEWNLLHDGQLSLSVAPVASPDSIYSSEETKLSAILKTTDAPSSPPYSATSPTFSKTSPSSTPLLLPTDTSDCEAFSSLSSLPTPLFLPPLPSPCLPLILYLRLASSCLQIGGLNSCAAIIGQDKDIKALITRSKICVNENTVREKDSAYKLISYPLNQINNLMLFDREENDTRRWPPTISYKIKRFIEYTRSASELDNLGDLSLFVCVQVFIFVPFFCSAVCSFKCHLLSLSLVSFYIYAFLGGPNGE